MVFGVNLYLFCVTGSAVCEGIHSYPGQGHTKFIGELYVCIRITNSCTDELEIIQNIAMDIKLSHSFKSCQATPYEFLHRDLSLSTKCVYMCRLLQKVLQYFSI